MKKKKLTKEERKRYDSLLKQMKRYEKRGVEITLSGEELPLEDIAAACAVKEHGCYMGDYIWDDKGVLSEIRYDKVGGDAESRK
ncbi:hypothetical protein LQE92_11165 [Lacrimispora sp. NSJ-141]|uniref:Uncharacterized protein n=1 Tax=Lientehia hominis TaxID=2897778 RepID=A0AAP2RJK1_9FIRM|nr:hypothetical protein [Lientehia hominis]MCD2493177.1 hypothetical protein [Lientehia hominis]